VELGEVVAGQKSGRMNAREVSLFRSVVARLDVMATASVYWRAVASGLGLTLGR
jgi:ornithine cyclodeaminase/alanine dehydrogenase-like protein (mu-crystallin family)